MRVLILSLALLTAVPAFADVQRSPRDCVRPDAVPVAATSRAESRRLDRLPRAKQFLTVFRTVGGCPTPVIVRDDIGAVPHR